MEEAGARTAMRLRDFNSHDAELEQAPDELGVERRTLVHLADSRPDALFREASQRCSTIDALDDAHVSSDYRRRLAVVLARRALERASGRAGHPIRSAHAGMPA